MKPRHRTHAGWVDEVKSRPELSRRVKAVLLAVVDGTYVNKARNTYGVTQQVLADRLGVDRRNVKRALNDAVDSRWLVICTPGHKGRQQVYHRATPWDAPRYWQTRPCQDCGGRFTVRRSVRARLVDADGLVVDPLTGEVVADAEDGIGGHFAPINRPPDRPPYVSSSSAPNPSLSADDSSTSLTLNIGRLVSLASRSHEWAGWQAVASIMPMMARAS